MNTRSDSEEAYVGKSPAFFLGVIFNRFLVVYAAIIVVVRVAGSNGFRIVPRSLEPAAVEFVSFVFPAFRFQYEQLATLANESVQSQYLTVIFSTICVGFGVTIFGVVKYSKVWRQLAAPDGYCYFTIFFLLPGFLWPLTHEQFKENSAVRSLTSLFFDSSVGWFYIRQMALVLTAQLIVAVTILTITQLILMHSKLTNNGG